MQARPNIGPGKQSHIRKTKVWLPYDPRLFGNRGSMEACESANARGTDCWLVRDEISAGGWTSTSLKRGVSLLSEYA